MKKKFSLLITLALTVFLTTGCDFLKKPSQNEEEVPAEQHDDKEKEQEQDEGEQGRVDVESIVLDEEEVTLNVGEDYEINAKVLPANANQGLIFKSGNENVCTVSFSGLVFAENGGETNITISSIEDSRIHEYFHVTVNEEEHLGGNYRVFFNANGGTGTMTQQTTEGSTYTTPECTFTYSNHTFKEWALGSADGTKYAVGATIEGITNNITLYAIWEKVVAPGDFNGYYDGISDSLTGTSLLNALHSLNSTKRKKTVGYGGMRQFAALSDADPDGSGKIIGFYDNKKVGPSWDSGDTWNREHVWPNVRDGDKVEDDAHMVRPASTSTNSGRGSKGFGSDSYDPGEDVAYYRGAAARIIFYAAIADTSLEVVDYSFPYDGVGSGNHGYAVGTMGSLSEMLEWNLQYLPSDKTFTGDNDLARRTELNRNEVIQNHSDGQGNRNPFIDHPEYACKIWGNTNSKTKSICGM